MPSDPSSPVPGPQTPKVEVEELTRHFGELVAVDHLSFTVAPGELFGIVGPDGAGKTTTLRMLAGILRPTSGHARLGGADIACDPEGVKHVIAYMAQRFGLYADLTVLENLHFYADIYRVARRDRPSRLARLFEFSNLGSFQDRLAGKLSGGMKQKLALSCCLIHQPEILLLDEPTFGVDPVSRRDLWLIIHEMTARGITVVVSTAYMDEAERFDRVLLLDHARALALDTPRALQLSLRGEILVVHLARAREARAALADHPSVRRATVFGERLHVTVGDAARDRPAVEDALRGAGFEPISITVQEPSMEDLFIERVGRR
jgi:ABC-2 type transport system ATP-binding protein